MDLFCRLRANASLECSLVLRDPAPSGALSAFCADGLEFTVGFWMADPENGQMGLRSQVNLAILRSLRAHGIDIPFPQQVLHLTGAAPGQMPLAGSDRALAD